MKNTEKKIQDIFIKSKLTLSVAESCTGGLICSRLTNIPGASKYFLGGVISYDNRVKIKVLGVKESTINKFGVVSRQTACEMAAGVRRLTGSDVSVAVTGIAGPGGGTKQKPVGLVYIAAAYGKTLICKKFLFKGTRRQIRTHAASSAMVLISNFSI